MGGLMLISPHSDTLFDCLEIAAQGEVCSPATVNSSTLFEASHISMLLYAHIAPATNPLTINLSCVLRTVNNHNVPSNVARQNLLATSTHQISELDGSQRGERGKRKIAALMNMLNTFNLIPEAQSLCNGKYTGQKKRLSRPSKESPTSPISAHSPSHIAPARPQPTTAHLSLITAARIIFPPSDGYNDGQNLILFKPNCPLRTQQPILEMGEEDTTQTLTPNNKTHSIDTEDPTGLEDSLNVTNSQTAYSSLNSLQATKRHEAPTRRSSRLQEKNKQSSKASPTSRRIKKKVIDKVTKIPFNLDTSLSSLDAELAVQLRQTTGLDINEQVRQMIEDAANQDKAKEFIDQLMPTTPLHDPVPPLTIPGIDILL